MSGHCLSVLLLSGLTALAAGCRAIDIPVAFSPKIHAPKPVQRHVVPKPIAEATKTSLENVRLAPAPNSAAEQRPSTANNPAPIGKTVVAPTKFVRGKTVEPKTSNTAPRLRSAPSTKQADNQPTIESAAAPASTRQIDLATSLALVAGQNPQVAFVQERVREAWARLDAAEVLWLPSLRAGVSYNKHEGNIQDVGGAVLNVSRGSMFGGLGARAVGAGSPAVPGLYTQFNLADAIFQPIVAKRTISARQHRVTATTNNELLRAALAYIELVEAGARKQIAEQTKAELKKLAYLTASFSKRGQGTQADADRAQTELQLQTNVVTRAEEALKVASARLAEVLNIDEGIPFVAAEADVVSVEMVPVDAELTGLVIQALKSRPELCENQYQVDAAWNHYKREKYSPLVPNVGLGVSYGGYAGGVGDSITNNRDRFDFDALLYWEVRNFGLGERAARNTAKSQMHQTRYRRAQLTNVVRREVTTAHAQLASAAKQIEQADASVKSANDSMSRNFKRIRQGQGLPLEVLQAIQALDKAKRERLNAKAAHNGAQFRLLRAIGWPTDRQAAG